LDKHEIVISADLSYEGPELVELSRAFERIFRVDVKRIERLSAEQLPPLLIVAFGMITSGFFAAIGRDAWELIKQKVATIVSKKRPNGVSDLEFRYESGSKKVRLKVSSEHEKVIKSAFDQIESTLEHVDHEGTRQLYFEFDADNHRWRLASWA